MCPDARRSPEIVAAMVNAAIVLLVPVALSIAALTAMSLDTTHAGVSAASSAWRAFATLIQIAVFVLMFIPFAAIGGWRTWVHARRCRLGQGTGWQGVAEAAGIGFFTAVWVLYWGIVNRPTEAFPYVVFYGGAALVIGLLLGLILRAAAVLVLRHLSDRP